MAGIFSVVTTLRDQISEERDEAADVPVAKLYPHVPNLVTFIDHNKALPWTKQASGVLMFADISGAKTLVLKGNKLSKDFENGFTALSERYSAMSTSGADQLTRTLNGYLGSLVELILKSKGDVLKFAGDAILALWQTRYDDVSKVVESVAKCCIDIQEKCGLYETDVGVTLTVKMGVAHGDITFSFVGNDEFRHYVESGPAVDDVKQAEKHCQSGYVVLSPRAWKHCNKDKFQFISMVDGEHVRVMSMTEDQEDLTNIEFRAPDNNPMERGTGRRHSAVTESISGRRGSLVLTGTGLLSFGRRRQSLDVGPFAMDKLTEDTPDDSPSSEKIEVPPPLTPQRSPLGRQASMEILKRVTRLLGTMPKKIRLYVLSPVLKKLDDGQPLEYLSEMRQISVIFMNLSLVETNDISGLMQNLFTIVYRNVKNLQGCLNKIFLFDKGCSFLVIFGLPGYKHEQDCAYALQCSVGISDDLKGEPGVTEVSIGVTTGTAFCGVVGHKDRHEYSVIGRKVNMAARLMMHYPGTITCDDETFSGSRLPPQAFEVMPTKEMKGLQNVGTLRQFVATGDVDATQIHALKHFHYPILGREKELEVFSKMVHDKQSQPNSSNQKQMIVIESEGGLGKTRLLDAMASKAPDLGLRVVSCALYMEDINKPYFLAQLVLRMLLTNAGFSEKLIGANNIILELKKNNLLKYLPLLKLIMGQKRSHFDDKAKKDKHEWEKALHAMVNIIVKASLLRTGLTLFAIDDIHFADTESWKLLSDMQVQENALFVITMKPPQMNQKLPEGWKQILADQSTRKLPLEGLNIKYMCALACQILNVVRIPTEINRILEEKSHGHPSWCEQLLQDLLTENQLVIMNIDGTGMDYYHTTVAPSRKYITIDGARSITNITETENEPQPNEAIPTISYGTSLKPVNVNDDVSTSMMSLLKPAGHVETTESICILHPDLKPEDLKIPESVKDMMVARLDALRAAEQMLVKCASVLSSCFYRKTLIEVMPNQVKKKRVDLRIENLLKSGIFACGGTKTSHDGSTVHDCDCKATSGDQKEHKHCSILRFQNPMLRETVRNILLANQRLNLHLKAAIQLDKMADKYRNQLPKYLLGRDSFLITENVNRGPGTAEASGQKSLADFADGKSDKTWITLSASEAAFVSYDGSLEIHVDSERLDSPAERGKCLQMLEPLYTMIADHWRGALEKYKLLCILIEAVFAALALEEPLQADSLLEGAQAALVDFENTDKDKYTFHADDRMTGMCMRAKLERLQGMINQQQSFVQEAQMSFVKALRILGHYQPISKRTVDIALSWKLRGERSRERCPSCYGQSRRSLSEKVSEQVYCLNHLYQVHKEIGKENSALLNALQLLAKTRSFNCNYHQVILTFDAVIQQCRQNGWFDMVTKMEKSLFTRCKEMGVEKLTGSDLQVLAGIYGDSSVQSLSTGGLSQAILSGMFSSKISSTLGMSLTLSKYLPTLIQTQLMTLKILSCGKSLESLKSVAEQTGNKQTLAWFYCSVLDVILDTGQPVETFEKTMMFICWLYSKPEAIQRNELDTALPSYLFIRFAVWNCRKRNFLEADRWFQVAVDIPPLCLSDFFSLQYQARHIECLLLTLCEAKKAKLHLVEEKITRAVSKELASMKSELKTVPSLRPRFLHLCAYFYAQNRNLKRCKQDIVECAKISVEHGNALELSWSQYNFREWTATKKVYEIRDSIWLSYSDGHVFDWRRTAEISKHPEFYPWPVPGKLVNKL